MGLLTDKENGLLNEASLAEAKKAKRLQEAKTEPA